MTTTTIIGNAPAGPRITGITAHVIERSLVRFREYRQRRAGIAELRAMSPHQLKDIGINPSECSVVPAYEVDAATMAILMSLR